MKMPSINVLNELCVKISAKIYPEKILTGVCVCVCGGGGGWYVSDAYYSATYSREVPNALMVLFLFDRVENFVGEENAGYRC